MLSATLTRDQLYANGAAPASLLTVDPSKLTVAPPVQEKAASNTAGNKWIWIVAVLSIVIVAVGIYFLVNRKK